MYGLGICLETRNRLAALALATVDQEVRVMPQPNLGPDEFLSSGGSSFLEMEGHRGPSNVKVFCVR